MTLPPHIESVSHEAVFRFQVVGYVLSCVQRGMTTAHAVTEAVTCDWWGGGALRRVSKRSVYRWLAAYQQGGLAALERRPRTTSIAAPAVSPELLRFFAAQKQEDRQASIPELIRRARELGKLRPTERLDRSSVYRALVRTGVPVRVTLTPTERDCRRFAFPHRMDCILADGKHFRAGAQRLKRVALFFLDDATRMGLGVRVLPAESCQGFLEGLYDVICRFGIPGIVYLDHGPGFIADDTISVVANLGATLVHGEKKYPQGHGKIERFHRTATAALLRGLDGRPDVDPACDALTLRLGHYLRELYVHTAHDGIDDETPYDRFHRDTKGLRMPESDAEVRRRFVVHLERTVSKDHIVSIDSVSYEMPRGHAERRVTIHHRLLEQSYACLHDGQLVDLHAVDLVANARDRRGRKGEATPPSVTTALSSRSAADMAFDRDFSSAVDKDGGCHPTTEEE